MIEDRNVFENLLKEISDSEQIVIYGAGRYGQLLLKQLYSWGIYKKGCFAETCPSEKREVMGWDICNISEFQRNDNKTVIIVAVGVKLMEEMVNKLHELGITNYFILTDEMRRGLMAYEQQIPSRDIMHKLQEQEKKLEATNAQFNANIIELQSNISELRQDILQSLKDVSQSLQDISQLQQSVAKLQKDIILLENNMSKSITNIINEQVVRVLNERLTSVERTQQISEHKLGYITEKVSQGEDRDSAPLISVLVPIYNMQQYLKICLDSLCRQSFKNFEVICINDGSTDESLDIVQEYMLKDSRFRLVSKDNTGYGDSMNRGLQEARGIYIGILESDDFAEYDMLQRLYAAIVAYDADIAVANYYIFHNTDKTSEFYELMWRIAPGYGRILTKEEQSTLACTTPSIWKGLYRREFLLSNEINFLPTKGASYQDTSFAFKAYMSADKVIALKQPVLHYRRDHETASVQDTSKVFCICDEFVEIRKYIEERNQEEWYPSYAKALLDRYYWNYNRLTGNAQKEFWKRFLSDIKECIVKGWLEKQQLSVRDKELFSELL